MFKKLFGNKDKSRGSSGGKRGFGGGDSRGVYLYVQPHGCDEIVQVRVDVHNDLSESDDGSVYFSRKLARGAKCTRSVELEVFFDGNRKYVETKLNGGVLVDEAAYLAWQEANQQK